MIALASESPEGSCGRPISHWMERQLAHEAIKQGIVAPSPPATSGVFKQQPQN
jgi:hypothetical protein